MKGLTFKRAAAVILLLAGCAVVVGLVLNQFRAGKNSVVISAKNVSLIELKSGMSHESGSSTHYDHAVWGIGYATTTEDMIVTEFSTTLRGTPPESLHEFYLDEFKVPDPQCAQNDLQILGGTTYTRQREPIKFKKPFGILVPKGTVLKLSVMFVSQLGNPYETGSSADFSIALSYERPHESDRTRFLEMKHMRLVDCKRTLASLPLDPHVSNKKYDSLKDILEFGSDGEIIGASAHFHGLILEHPTTSTLQVLLNGSEIERIESVRKPEYADRNPTLLKGRLPLKVKSGDRMWILGTYSNPTDKYSNDAMGVVSLYFSPFSSSTKK